jgi:hypothetical protein
MMGPTHRLLGLTTYLAALPLIPGNGWQHAAGLVIAGATSNGKLSPDLDGYDGWEDVIPGPHRGPMHYPELVALATVLLTAGTWAAGQAHPLLASVLGAWLGLSIGIGWLSHCLGDFLFGKNGLPTLLFGTVGLHLDVDGWFEWWCAVPVLGFAVVTLTAWHLGVDFTVQWREYTFSTAPLR